MKLKDSFHIVDIAGEFIAVPVGEESTSFKGVVALNDEAAFLLKAMYQTTTQEALANLLVEEYDVDINTAMNDIGDLLAKLQALDMLEE